MEEEKKMIIHNMPNMNSTRQPTSQNHSSVSLESNNTNLIIMNITQACKSPNTPDNGDKGINTSVHTSHMLVSHNITDKANDDDDENGEGETRVEESGRERLKRHREEVMGKVKIPKNWGQEKLLKDWVDYTTFDALFPPHKSIITARDALIAADGRKARSQILRVHTNCFTSN